MDGPDEVALFRRRVGNTPLLRCRKLEEQMGVGEVRLKLEGTNPTGHKSDRISHRIVRSAHQQGFDTITLGTLGYLANSIRLLSDPLGINCVFFVPELNESLMNGSNCRDGIRYQETGGTLEDAIQASREAARTRGWYDANPGLDNTLFGMTAYSPIAGELVRSFGEAPDTVSMSIGTGTLMSGIHLGFRQLWSQEETEGVPMILGGSVAGANAIVEAFKEGRRAVTPLDEGTIHESAMGSLVNVTGLMGQPALEALLDTNGVAYGFRSEELEEVRQMARELEDVRMSVDSAASLAALMRAAQEGLIDREGRHVVILSTGRTDLTIQELSRAELGDNLDLLINVLDKWLVDFTDPKQEIREALENALDNGYVLAALVDRAIVGICVLSTMELDTFFPRYHLSYIAADNSYEGRGVGTLLIQRAAELTGGEMSLHVERDNEKAIKLYQKMGFDIKYHRMHYQGGGEI